MLSKKMETIIENLLYNQRKNYSVDKEMEKLINCLCDNNCYSPVEQKFLFEAAEGGFTKEQLAYICNGGAHLQEMIEIADGILQNMSNDQLDVYARKLFNVKEMRLLKDGLLNGQSIDYMKFYAENLLALRKASYECAMIQFQLEMDKMLEKTNGEVSRSSRQDIERKMQVSASTIESEIYALILSKADELIAIALEKQLFPKKQKKDLDSKIKEAKNEQKTRLDSRINRINSPIDTVKKERPL